MASYCPTESLEVGGMGEPELPYQNAFRYGGVHSTAQRHQAHRRRPCKRKKCRAEDEDQFECPTPKRFLSEEAVTSYLEQLNIATCNPPARTPQLNIRTVAACPASMDQMNTRGEISDRSLMRGTSSAGYTNLEPNGMSTYLRTALPTSMPSIPEDPEPQQACQESSSPTIPPSLTISESSDVSLRKKFPPHLAGVQIEVTPATPTGTSELVKLHQEDLGDTMAITPLPRDRGSGLTTSKGGLLRKNWDVIIEDLSSDSSDGHESPQRPMSVWLAPEIQKFSSCKKDLLLPHSILEQM